MGRRLLTTATGFADGETLLETKLPQRIYVWTSPMLADRVAGIAIATCSGVPPCGDYCGLSSDSSVARTFSISRAHWSARDAIISRSRCAASG
jgi:hypothetical protein